MIFQIIAIIILLTFYGCYFIKMINQKKKGVQTDQLGRGKEGFSKFIETTMKIVTVIVPIVEVVSICINTSNLPLWARWLGAILGILGVVTFICAVLAMRDNWRAGVSTTDKTELITSGIYQISRNPAFLGFDLVYIGILMMFFNKVLLITSALAALVLHLQIVNVEEDFLIATFGDEYLDYRKMVNRYLGRKKVKFSSIISGILYYVLGLVGFYLLYFISALFGIIGSFSPVLFITCFVILPLLILVLPIIIKQILKIEFSKSVLLSCIAVIVYFIIILVVRFSILTYMGKFTVEKWDNENYTHLRYLMIDDMEQKYDFVGMNKEDVMEILGTESCDIRENYHVYDNSICYFVKNEWRDSYYYGLEYDENGVITNTYTTYSD